MNVGYLVVFVMACAARSCVPFAATSLGRIAAGSAVSETGEGSTMRPLTGSVFVVMLAVTVAIACWAARRIRTARDSAEPGG